MPNIIEQAEFDTRANSSTSDNQTTRFVNSSLGRVLRFEEVTGVVRDASSSRQQVEEPVATDKGFAAQVYEHLHYLDRLVNEQFISPDMRHLASDLWWKLSCSVDDGDLVAVPDASPGSDGELIYIWKRGDHYFSVEMSEVGPAEYFYRNHRTGETWYFECDPKEKPVPREVVAKLTLFQKHS